MGVWGRIWKGAKGAGRAFTRPATALPPECERGTIILGDVGEVCIDDLVLDPETGDLVLPAEAEERRRARNGEGAEVLVWDGRTSEWVTIEELNRREARRQERHGELRASFEQKAPAGVTIGDDEEEVAEGDAIVYPYVEGDQFDVAVGEWVRPAELSERERERRRIDAMLAQTIFRERGRLPRLTAAAARRIQITPEGIATVDGKPATEALAEGPVDDDMDIPGALKRAEKERRRLRLALIAGMVAVTGAILLRWRRAP